MSIKELALSALHNTKLLFQFCYGFLAAMIIALATSMVGSYMENYQDIVTRYQYFANKITQAQFDAIYHNAMHNTFFWGILILIVAIALFIGALWLQRDVIPIHRRLGWVVIILFFWTATFTQTALSVKYTHDQGIEYFHPERQFNHK